LRSLFSGLQRRCFWGHCFTHSFCTFLYTRQLVGDPNLEFVEEVALKPAEVSQLRFYMQFSFISFTSFCSLQVHLDASAMQAYQAELESASAAPLPDDGALPFSSISVLSVSLLISDMSSSPCRRHLRHVVEFPRRVLSASCFPHNALKMTSSPLLPRALSSFSMSKMHILGGLGHTGRCRPFPIITDTVIHLRSFSSNNGTETLLLAV
jgi:hypothetical protein